MGSITSSCATSYSPSSKPTVPSCEITYRLVTSRRVPSISWNATGAGQEAKKAPRSQTGKLVQMTPDFRMYYAVRNAIYLDFRRLTLLSAPLFAINLTLLLGGTGAKALLAGRPGNAKALFDAVTDGLRGRLGRAAGYPLP